jgi:hypothetical protein
MNNSFIKNLAFNLAAGALAFVVLAYTDINLEAALTLFIATGLTLTRHGLTVE